MLAAQFSFAAHTLSLMLHERGADGLRSFPAGLFSGSRKNLCNLIELLKGLWARLDFFGYCYGPLAQDQVCIQRLRQIGGLECGEMLQHCRFVAPSKSPGQSFRRILFCEISHRALNQRQEDATRAART